MPISFTHITSNRGITGGGSSYPDRCGVRGNGPDSNIKRYIDWYSGRGVVGGYWSASNSSYAWSFGAGARASYWNDSPLNLDGSVAAH